MEKEKVDLLPQWMQQEEIYDPPKDRELYISRSILSLLRVLLGIKLERGRTSRFTAKSSLSLFITVLFVLLTASSHNMVFIWLMVALVMLRISFLPIEVLKSVLKVVLSAVVFTVLVLLPSALLGATNAFFQITLKMIVSSALIGIFSGTRNWNQITAGLKAFHVPDMFIFILDLTLKYIVLLGDLCLQILYALRLRSVGRNNQKHTSAGGVLGVTFLKSREMAGEMFQAMECRGFEGEYVVSKEKGIHITDVIYLLAATVIIVIYVYLW